MKKLTLPTEMKDYIPSGIYALPVEQRRDAVNKMFQDIQDNDSLSQARQDALNAIRGNICIDKISLAKDEIEEESKLAYEISDEVYAKPNNTELEKKILHLVGMIIQTHGFLLDK